MPDINYARERILESCRLLFDQEVRIITLVRYYNGVSPFDNLYGDYYTAIVLPKDSSLKSVATNGILFESERPNSNRDLAIWGLLDTIERKMGTVFGHPPKWMGSSHWISEISPISSICISGYHIKESEPSFVTVSTQTTEENEMESDEVVGATIIGSGGKRVEETISRGGKIWRVVGYTSSGEPCIEEHEPETPSNNDPIALSQRRTIASNFEGHSSEYPVFDSGTIFTPGTSVVSDSGTITPSVYDDHLPAGYAKRLGDANMEIIMLRRDLGEVNGALGDAKKEIGRLELELLDANDRSESQQRKIDDYEAEKEQSQIATESLSKELASLKESIRLDQEARATEKQAVAEFMRSFMK